METKDKDLKTIKLCVYFHTSDNGIKLEPKVALKAGWVSMPTNPRHGIRRSDVKAVYFGKSQGGLYDAIIKCLKNNKIKFVEHGKEIEYRKFQEAKSTENFYDKDIKI